MPRYLRSSFPRRSTSSATSVNLNFGRRGPATLGTLLNGVIVSDYATLMVEILKDNARPEAGEIYAAMDMPWAKLVGQIAHAYGK